LLVEDEQNDVVLLERALGKAGLTQKLEVVSDGEAAMTHLARLCADIASRDALPGLVLLDLKLPRRSGLELLAWMRAQPALRRIPVVMLTSSRLSDEIRQAYDLGANSYLVKPAEFDGLVGMMKVVVPYWLGLNEPADPLRGSGQNNNFGPDNI